MHIKTCSLFVVALLAFCQSALCATNLPGTSQDKTTSQGQTVTSAHTPTDEITAVISKQQAAWNAGDIDGFMEGYWKSEGLTFSSGGEVTRGWQATIDRYKSRYTSRDLMGTLTFSELEVTLLGDDAALVLGRWKLDRDAAVEGNFSLVFRKLDGQWLIIHDHTSVSE